MAHFADHMEGEAALSRDFSGVNSARHRLALQECAILFSGQYFQKHLYFSARIKKSEGGPRAPSRGQDAATECGIHLQYVSEFMNKCTKGLLRKKSHWHARLLIF